MRFVSYNIHRCVGADGTTSVAAVGDVLAGIRPDVAGLNEVLRTPGRGDQPGRLGRMLGMRYRFQRTTWSRGLPFGNAALVRGRIYGRHRVVLATGRAAGAARPLRSLAETPTPSGSPRCEPRGLFLLDLEVEGVRFAFGVTHLDPKPELRSEQLDVLAAVLPRGVPLVLVGDFNAAPEELRVFRERAGLELAPSAPTFPAHDPSSAIDHVLFSERWRFVDARVVPSAASDHAALAVDLASVY